MADHGWLFTPNPPPTYIMILGMQVHSSLFLFAFPATWLTAILASVSMRPFQAFVDGVIIRLRIIREPFQSLHLVLCGIDEGLCIMKQTM